MCAAYVTPGRLRVGCLCSVETVFHCSGYGYHTSLRIERLGAGVPSRAGHLSRIYRTLFDKITMKLKLPLFCKALYDQKSDTYQPRNTLIFWKSLVRIQPPLLKRNHNSSGYCFLIRSYGDFQHANLVNTTPAFARWSLE